MAVISATGTRKRILATLPASPCGPFRDPAPVTTHSFLFSSRSLCRFSHAPRMYFPRSFFSFFPLVSLSASSSSALRSALPRLSLFAVRRLARPCIIYITRAARGCACTLQLHTTPFCRSLCQLRESTSTSTNTIRPRSRPRPCLPAKIGAVTLPRVRLLVSPSSLARSLARSPRAVSLKRYASTAWNALTLSWSTALWLGSLRRRFRRVTLHDQPLNGRAACCKPMMHNVS